MSKNEIKEFISSVLSTPENYNSNYKHYFNSVRIDDK